MPAKRVLSIRISEELYQALLEKAQEEGLSLTQTVEKLLRQALGIRETRLEKIEESIKTVKKAIEDITDVIEELAEECCEDRHVVRRIGIMLYDIVKRLREGTMNQEQD